MQNNGHFGHAFSRFTGILDNSHLVATQLLLTVWLPGIHGPKSLTGHVTAKVLKNRPRTLEIKIAVHAYNLDSVHHNLSDRSAPWK